MKVLPHLMVTHLKALYYKYHRPSNTVNKNEKQLLDINISKFQTKTNASRILRKFYKI